MEQATNFVTYKELIMIVLASSGILTLVFTIISKLFDRSSRVAIMEEINKIDNKYQIKVDDIKREVGTELKTVQEEVNEVRINYLDRFAEMKSLIVSNKETAETQHSAVMNCLGKIETKLEFLKK